MRFNGKEILEVEPLIKSLKNSFTYEFWVKPLTRHKVKKQSRIGLQGTDGQNYVIGPGHGQKGCSVGVGVSVGMNGISVYEHTEYYFPATLVHRMRMNNWTHVAVVYHRKRPFLFVNGEYVKKGIKSKKENVYASAIIGGIHPYGYFKGYLKEVKIWNYARSPKEIKTNMMMKCTGEEDGLYGYWNLNNKSFFLNKPLNIESGFYLYRQAKLKYALARKEIIDNKTTEIDVVVCIHNALEVVKNCLESLVAKKTISFNLILVDDGSDKGTGQFLKEFQRKYHCKLIRNTTARGYTIAANLGLKSSTAKYCVLLNSDTVVTLNWLEKLVECMESCPNVGLVGPVSNAASYQSIPNITDNGKWATNDLSEDMTVEEMARIINHVAVKEYPDVELLNGFCLMIKRDVLEKIGYFDEELFSKGYGEENDYGLRAREAGFTLKVCENCYIYHYKSQSYTNEKRSELVRIANQSLYNKYSEDLLMAETKKLSSNKCLNELREQVKYHVVKRKDIPCKPSILFLLPVRGGGGGVHSIIQEVQGLQAMNVNAKILTRTKNMESYQMIYPGCSNCLLYYENEEEMLRISKHFDIVVATIFTSVSLTKKIIDQHSHMIPSYYIQDYEPWFFSPDNPMYQEAMYSYELIPHVHAFAKTEWLCQLVKEKHNLSVFKVNPSLDRNLYSPLQNRKHEKNPILITAMVRPSTPRRSPKETMEVLKKIKEKYDSKVKIIIFGCSNVELGTLGTNVDFDFVNVGVLLRKDVASLLKEADIFIDLSTYQAFGRTGLEAMAVGCSVILPKKGGTNEYAIHEKNCYLVDVEEKTEVIKYISQLIESPNLRKTFSEDGIKTAKSYSIEKAAQSEYQFFCSLINYRQSCNLIGENNV